MTNRIFKFIMEKLCGKTSETSREEVTFFGRICGLFRRRVKEKINPPENPKALDRESEIITAEEPAALQPDKQKSAAAQPRLTAIEKHERRMARRAEKHKDAERIKSAHTTTKSGVRLLPDNADIIKEMTGGAIVGIEPPIHEALREKETDEPVKQKVQDTINNVKISLKQIDEEDMLKINLHGYTRSGIGSEIDGVIRKGEGLNERFVLIITGRGKNSENGEAKLKPDTEKMLREKRKKGEIKDFMEAPGHMGGAGAFVVVLR